MEKKRPKLSDIYFKVARTFYGIEDLDLARKTCDRALERFPEDAQFYGLKGRVLISQFNKSSRKEDLVEALTAFEKSLTIDSENYFALIMTAKIYIKSKAYQKARKKVEICLHLYPGDAKATEYLKIITKAEEALKEKSQEEVVVQEEEAIVSESGPAIDYDLLVSHIPLFTRIKGVEQVILTDIYGMIVKKVVNDGANSEKIGLGASSIFRASQNLIQRVGMGIFRQGVVMMANRHIYVLYGGNAILSIVVSSNGEHKVIENRINRYLQEVNS